ncbi:hypothetical protein [Clostridium estertheticum]|uniref:hypothetical protein n=1 Tax=Clostridium estertheticum TaxID=238834 RepID=UPI00124DFEAE|nr:hypothetical protein [Clostridium estertheticum]MBZ9616783.1 hypothetical protein [Clostridium estertheticum subsp. laramiense]WAG72490.1 hypothetical protein LL032_15195 [Clostridium estertheticum]
MSSESEEFEKFVLIEAQKEIEDMVKVAQIILKRNVDIEVYDSYSPVEYHRTYNLEKSITCDFDKTSGKIYFEESQLTHYSAVTNENTKDVPRYLDLGHKDSSGISGRYHIYEKTGVIDKTIDELEEIYGKGCVQRIGSD